MSDSAEKQTSELAPTEPQTPEPETAKEEPARPSDGLAVEPPWCSKRSASGWECTRPPGHEGQHVAGNSQGSVAYSRWPAAPVASPDSRSGSFWVVEQFVNEQSQGYWNGGSSRDFVKNIDDAMQFCRKLDANRAIWGWHWQDVKVTEHLYLRQEQADARPARTLLKELDNIATFLRAVEWDNHGTETEAHDHAQVLELIRRDLDALLSGGAK